MMVNSVIINFAMKKTIFIVVSSIVLSACTMPFSKSQKSALDVKSDPVAAVYINGDHVGSTPFQKEGLKPGEYTVKLVVESNPEKEWQTQVVLKPSLLTNITRFFGDTEDVSSHFTLSLEKNGNKDSGDITVISLPDSAVVKRDGQPIGFAPVEMTYLSPADYQISVGSPGYKQLAIPIKAIAGHKLTISAKLAKDKDVTKPLESTPEASTSAAVAASSPAPSPSPSLASPSPTPKASPKASASPVTSTAGIPAKPFVTILDTPTGWLRVRSEPSGVTENEVGKVDVGKSFPFLKNNGTGWYQIEYEEDKQGWISAQYAKLVE